MENELYCIILSDGSEEYAVPVGEGNASLDEALERVQFWNDLEGWTAQLGKVIPIEP